MFAALKSLDRQMDSLKAIRGDVRLKVVHSKFEILKFEDEPMQCLRHDNDLKIPKDAEIHKLVFNKKQSLGGHLLVTALMIALMIFIYVKIRK